MNVARAWAAAALLPNGKVLVAGGHDTNFQDTRSAELYDPVSGTWSLTGSMLAAHTVYQLQSLRDGRVFAFGGFQLSTGAEGLTTELYDPMSGTWSQAGDMNNFHADFFFALLPDGRVLAAGGCGVGACPGYVTPTAETFDPTTKSWSSTSSMVEARAATSMTALPDGRAVVTGGVNADWSATLASIEIYDARTSTWTLGAPMSTPRNRPIQALLPDGRLLVAGGSNGNTQIADSQVYDPSSDSWQPAGPMHVGRNTNATVTLSDGRVLVSGGFDTNGAATATAEIFTLGAQLGPPQASFAFSPTDPSRFDQVQFNDQSTDPDGGLAIVSRRWDFGDHSGSTDVSPTHQYGKDGSYKVTLTVATEDGRSATTTQTVQVKTHDVGVDRLISPTVARAGQTRPIIAAITNDGYAEQVRVELYRSSLTGFEPVGSTTVFVPVTHDDNVVFNYTFTGSDATIGKVSFQVTATPVTSREALPFDNTATSSPTRMMH